MTTETTPGAAIEGQVVLQAIEALADAVERLDLESAEAIRERDEAIALLRDLYRAGRVEADWCVFCEHPGDGHYEECQFHPVRAFLARFPEGGEG